MEVSWEKVTARGESGGPLLARRNCDVKDDHRTNPLEFLQGTVQTHLEGWWTRETGLGPYSVYISV